MNNLSVSVEGFFFFSISGHPFLQPRALDDRGCTQCLTSKLFIPSLTLKV